MAIKRIQKVHLADEDSDFPNEVDILKEAGDHENILRLFHTEPGKDFV